MHGFNVLPLIVLIPIAFKTVMGRRPTRKQRDRESYVAFPRACAGAGTGRPLDAPQSSQCLLKGKRELKRSR